MNGRTDVSGFGKPFARDASHLAIRRAFRRKWTFIGFLFALVLIGVGVSFSYYSSRKLEREFTNDFLTAQSAFDSEIKEFSEKLEKIEDFEKAQDIKPDHSKSTPLFQDFAQKHRDHPLGWQAALRAAQENIKSKKYDEALSLLLPILPKTRRFPILQVKIRETLAGLYAEQGDYVKALAELSLVEKIPENPMPEQTLLSQAQFTYLSGDKVTAAKLLEALASGRVQDRNISQDVAVEASTWFDYWELAPSLAAN